MLVTISQVPPRILSCARQSFLILEHSSILMQVPGLFSAMRPMLAYPLYHFDRGIVHAGVADPHLAPSSKLSTTIAQSAAPSGSRFDRVRHHPAFLPVLRSQH